MKFKAVIYDEIGAEDAVDCDVSCFLSTSTTTTSRRAAGCLRRASHLKGVGDGAAANGASATTIAKGAIGSNWKSND